MESFEKIDEYGYKYNFLEESHAMDEVGFVPHCERPDWKEPTFIPTRLSSFETIQTLFDNHYGKFKGMIHLHHTRSERRIPATSPAGKPKEKGGSNPPRSA